MAERLRRSKNDDRTARPPHPSLRHRRDRQRKLALQEPRLTRDNLSSTKPRSPRLRNPDQLRRGERCRRCPVTNRGQFWTPIGGQNWTPIDRQTLTLGSALTLVLAGGRMRTANAEGQILPEGDAYAPWGLWNDPSVRGTPLALVAAAVLAANPQIRIGTST